MYRLSMVTNVKGLIFLVILSSLMLSGCGFDGRPRARMGTLPTPPPGPRFASAGKLGRHSFEFNPFERNSIVYTCRAGHIDITHLRWNADYTRYCIKQVQKTLMKKRDGFDFRLAMEVSSHIAEFEYPANWDELSKKERRRIAEEISYEVGPYLAFNATLWHEIITWFGTHFMGFEPEFNSSFTWEDMYSNLLGTQLAVEAEKDKKHKYNTAMTIAIDKAIEELGGQSASVAIDASKKMRDKWYKGVLNVRTIRKNMDAGFDDGMVTPVLVDGVCPGAKPEPLPVPTTDVLAEYGFRMKYYIKPREWERGKIFRVAYGNPKGGKAEYIYPEKHFPIIMEHIKKEAVEKYDYIIE